MAQPGKYRDGDVSGGARRSSPKPVLSATLAPQVPGRSTGPSSCLVMTAGLYRLAEAVARIPTIPPTFAAHGTMHYGCRHCPEEPRP